MGKISRISGFTLTEIIIVITIIITITSLILANYSRFSDNTSLKNAVQDIALSVREAQAYGLAVKEFKTAGGQSFFPGYGVYFQRNFPDSYIFFADINKNKLYDGESELVEKVLIKTSSRIFDLCANKKTFPSAAICGLQNLTIIYFRPDPRVTLNNNAYCDGSPNCYADAEVVVKSPKGLEQTIYLWASGQISTE